jgi:hypothetical protein
MEQILHDHFQGHFNQAAGTPFTVAPWRSLFGYGGHNDNINKLLDGSLQILPTTPEMTALLNNFRRSRPPLSDVFPAEDIKIGFMKWRETTVTSPSGKNLGFYRSIIRACADNITTPNDKNDSITIANILFQIQVLLLNLAIRETHSFNRWQTVHNFAIEKIAGYPIINKLRVIHLFEADWNIILKYFTSKQVLANNSNQT